MNIRHKMRNGQLGALAVAVNTIGMEIVRPMKTPEECSDLYTLRGLAIKILNCKNRNITKPPKAYVPITISHQEIATLQRRRPILTDPYFRIAFDENFLFPLSKKLVEQTNICNLRY